ncbi:hypothetical protein PTTG_28199 [Puccinia triticina 1-1 BBBD Race 1]|uniref:Dynein heavy chain hydrolytic ATP-binding dynein motor region domain-containing protein n=1 Tax=Puccinia triticina (isolate 1-1 / race 1 (BBBD)) TaxID=630390 RepID=A0A180GEM8_PUCT1|nr:hypothetical protein PTTG_28199 [Puccinia triticina 1-1 BBBD Race 1]
MQFSLAELLCKAVDELVTFYTQGESLDKAKFLAWIKSYPAQLVVLAIQIMWTQTINNALRNDAALSAPLQTVLRTLDLLAFVLGELDPVMRQKCEHLINKLWLYHMQFYLTHRLSTQLIDFLFTWPTPCSLTDLNILAFQIDCQLGGSPFGPAGTGKTESVKALGVQLGQFVLVFCCDETFDFQAMGRIFVRLCQVGAWGCFDKANRLEESILSAVSQQIQSIQQGLKAALVNPNAEVELVGKMLKINPHTHGIFITMNPGYAGRSNLPDNLKKLFRSMAMTRPDRELIAQVMLFSQGFRTAETLASKVVPFFSLCDEQLSKQPHYDSGLRALKAVLTSAGHLKRSQLQTSSSLAADSLSDSSNSRAEQEILVQSVTETTVPKLVADDIRETPLVLFNNVLDHVLRINRVFHQVQGHLLLISVSGSGKTTLSRFVAWMNGLSVFQIKVHNKYTADDLDDDLRNVLRRSGCEAEKICFIMDESNCPVYSKAMNTPR